MEQDLATAASLTDVSKSLGGKSVLNRLSLSVRAGEVTALLGSNGAGKSTTVGLLIGRLQPDTGEVELYGLRPERPAARARLGVIPGHAGAVLAMTLREAVTNVIRHAEASACAIDLPLDGRLARLIVADDGVGRSFHEGLGLAGMRQRLTAAGGSLSIQPDAPGTRLVATVPA